MPNVLLVEDSPILATLFRKKIEADLGFNVTVADSYSGALSILNSGESGFFAGLLDLNLPDAPNGEIVDLVLSKNIPSIVFTGMFQDNIRKMMWDKGIVDYVIKGGTHNLEYVCSLIYRLHQNCSVKVLVVDDSATSRKYISALLKIHKYLVYEAGDGREALDMLDKNPDIKMVITDYNMPNMDGFELTREIRSKFEKEKMAVIGVSAQGNENLSAQFIKNGASDFITKPFNREEFYCRLMQNITMIDYVLEIEDQKKHLEHLNEQKNKFLGIAAHDLRTPISVINMYSSMILEEMEENLSEDQKEFINTISRSSNFMLSLLNDLLDISKIESGNIDLVLKKVDYQEFVNRNIKLNKTIAEKKNISIELYCEPTLSEIDIDNQKIDQVLNNLLSNAIKYSEPETTVKVLITKEDNFFLTRVIDRGQGIPENELPELFKEFTRTSVQSTAGEKSTGLGLAIVKNIVEAHRGKIDVTSKVGNGSTFSFTLPVE